MAEARDQHVVAEIAAQVRQGDLDAARARCEAFLNSVGEAARQAPVRIWLGMVEQRGGNLHAALVQYELARQIDRRNPHLTLQLGLAYFEMGNLECAEPLYRDAIRLEPRLPLAHYNLGVLLQQKRNFTAACRAFEAALVHQPRFPEALNNLGNVLIECEDPARAEQCYRQAIALRSDFSFAHHGLGLLLQQKRNFPAACRAFEAALVHQPRFPEALNNLGNVLIECEDLARAEQCYRQAIALRSDFSFAHHGLGLLLMRQMRHVEALPSLRAAVDHNPAFIDAWLDLAECQAQSGDVAAAKTSTAAVLARDPQHAIAGFRRAQYAGEQPSSTPPELVERLYASMAATFDEHLVQRLGYQIPSLLKTVLQPWLDQFAAPGTDMPTVLDLGCGTGLFGVQIRSAAKRLVGVDLSPQMLAVARARGIYDDLVACDVVSYLKTIHLPVELIAATDVLIYVGDLTTLFTEVAGRLTANGAFAFSVETPDDLMEGMCLQPSGRYAHSVRYIEQLAAANSLKISVCDSAIIRTENAVAMKGFLFILEKRR
ncbi:MAG: tetratricopeptide repeat protein [Burkholderiales bacterium]|nr:tetratricopeptide repeat protein [Burkholderiales bacterium]